MRYALFVDWENLWIEHLGRSFPGYVSDHAIEHRKRLEVLKRRTLIPPQLPEARHLDAASLLEVSQFPRVLMQSCTELYGAAPTTAVASAIWDQLPLASEFDAQSELRKQGFVTTRPSIDTSRTKKHHLKNASDYRLTLDALRTLLIERPADRKAGKKATPRNDVPYDAVVVVSGDFMFGQLLDFTKDVIGVQPYLLTFLHSLAGALHDKMAAPKYAGKFSRLEQQPAYADHRNRCLALDLLHAHKLASPVVLDRHLTMTSVKRLMDRDLRQHHHVGTTRQVFLQWLDQWMNYWSSECSIHPLYTPDQALMVLQSRQVVYVKHERKNQYIRLTDNAYIREYADLNDYRKYAFDHLFDVPPVHF